MDLDIMCPRFGTTGHDKQHWMLLNSLSNAHSCRVRDIEQLQSCCLELSWSHLPAIDFDEIFRSVDKIDLAVINVADIACLEPVIRKCFFRCLRIAKITGQQLRAFDKQFSGRATVGASNTSSALTVISRPGMILPTEPVSSSSGYFKVVNQPPSVMPHT